MFKNYAHIKITKHTIEFTSTHRSYFTFEWSGDVVRPVEIDNGFLGEFGLDSLPWPLVKIEEPSNRDTTIFIRRDVAGGWWAKLCVAWALLSQKYKWVKCRIIVTAMVWNLAWMPLGEEPQWSHIGKKRWEV